MFIRSVHGAWINSSHVVKVQLFKKQTVDGSRIYWQVLFTTSTNEEHVMLVGTHHKCTEFINAFVYGKEVTADD